MEKNKGILIAIQSDVLYYFFMFALQLCILHRGLSVIKMVAC